MKRVKHVAAWVLCAVLCLGLFSPLPVGAAAVYFTSVNDNLLPLTSDTMPFWSGGKLFLPYTVFDGRYTGIDLGITCTYDREKNVVSASNSSLTVTFDLSTGEASESRSKKRIAGSAVVRSGRPYLAVGTVCSFFWLDYSCTSVSSVAQGFLVRVKSSKVVLSDAMFLNAADDLIQRRMREFNQGTAPSAPASASPTGGGEGDGTPETNAGVTTFLAFRCESGEGTTAVLDVLKNEGVFAAFLVTPELAEKESGLVRRILGEGHTLGLLAQGESTEQVLEELERGRALLAGSACLRVTLAQVPEGARRDAEREGWVCWRETLALRAEEDVSAATFASNALHRLNGRNSDICLTLEAGEETVRVLSTLLRRLTAEKFIFTAPLETLL